MTTMPKQDILYGSDDTGRVWRAQTKPDQPSLTVLEVAYPGESPNWDLWAILDDSDMDDITDQNGIFWLKTVIEV